MKTKSARVKEEVQLECLPAGSLPAIVPPPAKPSGRGVSAIYLDKKTACRRPPIIARKPGKLIAFGWYGGKFSHLSWLLPLLPTCHHYCEPFAGSAAVLLNRAPAGVETYNDIDGEIVNFFRILRDQPRELSRQLGLTPFAREEFYEAVFPMPEDSSLERARKFYIRARQARSGLAQTATLGRWANCKNTSRAGMSGVVSRWIGGNQALALIAERLLTVQIENRPAIECVELYDSPGTLFYCDPPYLHETRGDAKAYGFEMHEKDHRQLVRTIRACRGKVALSGYRHPLMDELLAGWRRHDAEVKTCHSIKKLRQECLWMNY